jgi:hypothetical protein
LDLLVNVVVGGGAEALFRDVEILRALAQLAESNPAEYACRRAQLQRAGVKLRDLDQVVTPLRRKLRAGQPVPATAGAYRISGGRIVRIVTTMDGPIEVPLATWAGRIAEEIVRDDGAERSLLLAVEGSLQDGTPLPRVEVTSDDFISMKWPIPKWGIKAVVLPGASTADHLRCALQLLSRNAPRRTQYAHIGWRDIGGSWFYLHAGGAIGPEGPANHIVASLPDAMSGYTLPDPPRGGALRDAIRASLRVLDLAPDRITVPLLGAVYRAVLGPCDSALHLCGPTGAGKSELAAQAQQHHGCGLDARHLPGSWSSTGNSLEALAFTAKDALSVVDDFAPGGTNSDIARSNREADRLLRAQGNRAGRMRMRADATLRPAKPPRGIILSTGEDVPRGQSLRARILVLELSPGDLDWSRLTACQRHAANGCYAAALAGYLRRLAPNYATVRDGLRAEVTDLRQRAHAIRPHARTPGIVADLAVGWRHWLSYALAARAITRTEQTALKSRVWAALEEAAARQTDHLEAAEPCDQFLRLLIGALASGRAHLATPNGDRPADADAWGWRGTGAATPDGCGACWQPLGRRIGWLDGTDLYLEPESAYAEAQELARHQGESLAIGARTLWQRMRERKLLASRDEARQRNTVRRRLAGHERREVVHLRAEILSAPSPFRPAPSPLDHVVGGDDLEDGSRPARPSRPQVPSPTARNECSGNGSGAGGDGVDADDHTIPPAADSRARGKPRRSESNAALFDEPDVDCEQRYLNGL